MESSENFKRLKCELRERLREETSKKVIINKTIDLYFSKYKKVNGKSKSLVGQKGKIEGLK